MFSSVANHLREIVGLMDFPEGEVQKKNYPDPLNKPPRRNPSVNNKSNRSDYMQNYMKDYREKGKDYQKMTDKLKKYRREQRKKHKEKLKAGNPLKAHLLDQEISMWQRQYAHEIPHDEFVWICDRRGFSEEERNILLEDLYDANLIIH
jgi:hypothetical protein